MKEGWLAGCTMESFMSLDMVRSSRRSRRNRSAAMLGTGRSSPCVPSSSSSSNPRNGDHVRVAMKEGKEGYEGQGGRVSVGGAASAGAGDMWRGEGLVT